MLNIVHMLCACSHVVSCFADDLLPQRCPVMQYMSLLMSKQSMLVFSKLCTDCLSFWQWFAAVTNRWCKGVPPPCCCVIIPWMAFFPLTHTALGRGNYTAGCFRCRCISGYTVIQGYYGIHCNTGGIFGDQIITFPNVGQPPHFLFSPPSEWGFFGLLQKTNSTSQKTISLLNLFHRALFEWKIQNRIKIYLDLNLKVCIGL